MQNEGIDLLEKHVGKTIGLTFRDKGTASKLVSGLPPLLREIFDCWLIEIEGEDYLLLTLPEDVDLSTLRIINFANQISRQVRMPALLRFKSVDNIRRRTLIGNKVNFVVPNKQIYIPAMRMYLNEGGSLKQQAKKESFSPSAQLLLLYHLQKASLDGLSFQDVAKVLKYSKKTISLVAAELQRLSVCEVKQLDNRSKVLSFGKKGRDLLDSVSPLMVSPVHSVWYFEKSQLPPTLQLYPAFDTALSHYTFHANSLLASFAVDKNNFYKHREILQDHLHPTEGKIRLEVWKYNPAILSNKRFVDRISLSLCYTDSKNIIVKREITKMIDGLF